MPKAIAHSGNILYICNPLPRPDGGIGRRARLKIWLSQGSAGSIPVLGTLKKPALRAGFVILHTIPNVRSHQNL